MNEKILIVEDEAIIYDDLYRALKKHHFEVDEYTPSYDEAIKRIEGNRPDIALLDIKLKGKKTGIDLGKVLYEKYKIPFIYVTDFDDAHTFHKGLQSGADYYVVKTKPVLNIDEVVRAIYMLLYKLEKHQATVGNDNKIGLIGLSDYLSNIRDTPSKLTRIPVRFENIVFFTSDAIEREGKIETLRPNYIWFLTEDGQKLLMNTSLAKLGKKLPAYFVRINDHSIVNLLPRFFNGQVNGRHLMINGRKFRITSTFLRQVKEKISELYPSE